VISPNPSRLSARSLGRRLIACKIELDIIMKQTHIIHSLHEENA
jgi:hypothetical protein